MVNNIQAMGIQAGLNAKTSGSFESVELIHCSSVASITVHFTGGDEIVAMGEGDDRALAGHDITIIDGTYDINK